MLMCEVDHYSAVTQNDERQDRRDEDIETETERFFRGDGCCGGDSVSIEGLCNA